MIESDARMGELRLHLAMTAIEPNKLFTTFVVSRKFPIFSTKSYRFLCNSMSPFSRKNVYGGECGEFVRRIISRDGPYAARCTCSRRGPRACRKAWLGRLGSQLSDQFGDSRRQI